MEAEDEILLVRSDTAVFDGRTEVVHPAETAAFAAAEETGSFGKSAPPAFAFAVYVIRKQLVFLRRPRSFLDPYLAATRRRFGC